MSQLLDWLVGPAPAGAPSRCRWLRNRDGIELRLSSNAQDDQVMLISSPGSLPAEDASEFGPSLWQHTLAHPSREGVRLSLVVPGGSARVLLVDRWPRHAVRPQALVTLLDEHSQRHRRWREMLEGRGDEDGADPLADEQPERLRESVFPERLA